MAQDAESLGIYPQHVRALKDNTFSDKCPHCQVAFRAEKVKTYFGTDIEGHWTFSGALCPTCNRLILYLERGDTGWLNGGRVREKTFERLEFWLIRPAYQLPEPIPKDTPPDIAKDYREAAMVLTFSPNASAALSRRCLQHILEEVTAVHVTDFKKWNLYKQIEYVIDEGLVPKYLAEELHQVRVIGNFGAHKEKSETTGLIMPATQKEAQWNLGIVGRLLEFHFVTIPDARKRQAEVDKKSQEKES